MLEDIKNILDEENQKIKGSFPLGKLKETDEGAIAIGIGQENGKIVLKFPKPVAWLGFTPNDARAIAMMLIKHAESLENEK